MKVTPEIIAGFVGSVLAKRFDGATVSPQFHHELWELCCNPHPQVAVGAPRGHAKSTAGTLAYSLAEVLFRSSRFVLIISDTEAQASMFLGNLKQELRENEDLIELFGLKKNDKGEVQFIKDTETDIIVEFQDGHTFRIIGKGAEQKLRGLNWNGTRPDLIICDDLENDELVMNKERRDKLRRWFTAALRPALSPTGKLRMFGTVLHQDSLLERLMPENQANRKWVRQSGLKTWVDWPQGKIRGWLSVKYRAHTDDYSELLWPERFSAEKFKALREEAAKDGLLDLYSQEYLNIPLDESVSYFKRSDFLPLREEDFKKKLRYYITGDLAVSQESRADWTAFVICGVDEDKVLHVKNVIRERLDAKEIVDTILSLQKIYDPEVIGIEEMQISKAIGPFLREEMVKRGVFPNMVQLKHGGKDKVQRARSIQARMRSKTVKFDKDNDWYITLEDELMKFPRGDKDDQVDCMAYMGMLLDKIVEAPTEQETEEEVYQDELLASEQSNSGRNRTTGY